MAPITITALVLFAFTYLLMLVSEKYRPYIAVGSAMIFIILGITSSFYADSQFFVFAEGRFNYGFIAALGEIDWNVILMIAGIMGTVSLFIESKMPQLMSDILISKMPNVKWIIFSLSLFAGIVSAFVDNVATVIMIAPVALACCKKMKISPVSSIICIAISSNLQGAATLVGDTTSILLAEEANLDFSDFFVSNGKPGIFWVVEAGAVVSAIIILFMFRNAKRRIKFDARTQVEDKFPTLLLIGTVVALIAVSFVPYQPELTNGIICIGFFLIGVMRELLVKKNKKNAQKAFTQIDSYTLVMLIGLFVVLGGIRNAGVIDVIAQAITKLGAGSPLLVFTIIVWMSVLLSSVIDNIPYTATMLSIVPVIAGDIGIEPTLLYYGLLCGATLGGNLTPIGSSANIAAIGILHKEGYYVKAKVFMKYGVPFTLAAVATCYALIWLIWKP